MTDVYESLVALLLSKKQAGRALIVGINGVDGSGKTELTTRIGRLLESRGHSTCRVSVDAFHHPRALRYRRGEQMPEAYYHDSIDYATFGGALRQVFEAAVFPVECQTKSLDLARDEQDIRFQTVDGDCVVLAEGVFIFRPEIRRYLHFAVFVDARFETILERVKTRDLETLGSASEVEDRYRRKYIPGQMLYLAEVNPRSVADVVIDNDDYTNPRIVG